MNGRIHLSDYVWPNRGGAGAVIWFHTVMDPVLGIVVCSFENYPSRSSHSLPGPPTLSCYDGAMKAGWVGIKMVWPSPLRLGGHPKMVGTIRENMSIIIIYDGIGANNIYIHICSDIH